MALHFSLPASAQQVPLRKLLTADEAKAWLAVGRVNMRGAGFCTGALIAPDLVLTAAHCMYHPDTGALLKPSEIEFLAGLHSGRAVAERKARRVIIHQKYSAGRALKVGKVAHDIALVQLQHPITSNAIKAFPIYKTPHIGEDVKVVSYAQDRAEAPSIEEPCQVLGHDPRALVLTCNVDYGASGSPIFVVHNGQPKIASVVSAKAIVGTRKVALGTSLEASLVGLMA